MKIKNNDNIDYSFILSHEKDPQGDFGTQAFVPCDKQGKPIGKSGITFAGGLDIGQINQNELKNLCGKNQTLYKSLHPYIGLTGTAAQNYLNENPLKIQQQQLQSLTRAKYNGILQKLRQYYGSEEFDNIPKAARTILLSLAVQYGANLPRQTPRFWKTAKQQNWQAVLAELRDFGDSYKSRRNREADYLEQHLKTDVKPKTKPKPKPKPKAKAKAKLRPSRIRGK